MVRAHEQEQPASQHLTVAPPTRAQIFELPLDLHADYAQWVQGLMDAGTGAHVVTLNSEMAMLARQHAELAAAIARAELVVPDGSGAVLYLRLRGIRQQRCAGIELAAEAVARAPGPIVFYGGEPGRAAAAARTWQQRYPHLEIRAQHGFLDESEQETFVETLAALQPRLILVGLGVPRQELWIARHRDRCPQAVWIGVGGSFDIWAGAKTRAPRWMCDAHLEWLYRLYREPWRWRRMLVLPQFAWEAWRER